MTNYLCEKQQSYTWHKQAPRDKHSQTT